MNIEQDIINRAGKQMADEIDFGVLAEMLCGTGWRKIILSPMTWERGAEIDLWVEQHAKGRFETMGLVWIFEKEQDAVWFTLRWS